MSKAKTRFFEKSGFTYFYYQLPITNYQLPITNYPLPITHYQLPITHFEKHEQTTLGILSCVPHLQQER